MPVAGVVVQVAQGVEDRRLQASALAGRRHEVENGECLLAIVDAFVQLALAEGAAEEASSARNRHVDPGRGDVDRFVQAVESFQRLPAKRNRLGPAIEGVTGDAERKTGTGFEEKVMPFTGGQRGAKQPLALSPVALAFIGQDALEEQAPGAKGSIHLAAGTKGVEDRLAAAQPVLLRAGGVVVSLVKGLYQVG